jgi:thioredoxin reductase
MYLTLNKRIRNKNTETTIKNKEDKRENISNIFSCGNVRYHRQYKQHKAIFVLNITP